MRRERDSLGELEVKKELYYGGTHQKSIGEFSTEQFQAGKYRDNQGDVHC